MRAAKRNGNFDLGILEIRGHRPEAIAEANPPMKIYENPISRDLTLLHEIQHDKGILWEESEQVSVAICFFKLFFLYNACISDIEKFAR